MRIILFKPGRRTRDIYHRPYWREPEEDLWGYPIMRPGFYQGVAANKRNAAYIEYLLQRGYRVVAVVDKPLR